MYSLVVIQLKTLKPWLHRRNEWIRPGTKTSCWLDDMYNWSQASCTVGGKKHRIVSILEFTCVHVKIHLYVERFLSVVYNYPFHSVALHHWLEYLYPYPLFQPSMFYFKAHTHTPWPLLVVYSKTFLQSSCGAAHS